MKTPSLPKRPRGRPRSFDREQALERAMEVFWEKGFEGTSIADLTEAMGINPPSLYAAFGDKERLFLAATERYLSMRGDSCPYDDEPTAEGAVRELLTYMAEELTGSGHPRGCLMVMSVATSTNASAELQAALARKRAESRGHLKARIERGIRDAELPRDTDAGELADFYFTILSGMSLRAKGGTTRKSLLAIVKTAMRAWPRQPGTATRAARSEAVAD